MQHAARLGDVGQVFGHARAGVVGHQAPALGGALVDVGGHDVAGLDALGKLEFSSLSENQKLEIVRAYQLLFIRMGEPAKEVASKLAAKLDPFFPSNDERLNRDLGDLLVYLKSANFAQKF